MLFSDEQVAEFINRNFEAAWQSVRPVPIVRIDFGNGVTVTRTLNGNIATYVCLADGTVLDVLPGLYSREVYISALTRLVQLHRQAQNQPSLVSFLSEYHRQAHTELLAAQKTASTARERKTVDAAPVQFRTAEELRNWQALDEDARANETQRRRQVHELLATAGLVKPQQVTKRIYRDILHADLDDPYLGLGPIVTDPLRNAR